MRQERIMYNKHSDKLIILFYPNEPATSVDVDGEFWPRITPNNKIIVIEIDGFIKSFIPKYTKGK